MTRIPDMSIARALVIEALVAVAVLALAAGETTGKQLCGKSQSDFVSHLPGYDRSLPSPWYSGYLEYTLLGRQIHTHYVLVMAEATEEEEAPLIYWSNGGPGASSLFGLLTELGPLQFSDLSLRTEDYQKTGIPTPIYNPYTWSRLGSILVIDHPAPVGFSYCNNETRSHSCGGIRWTDELASINTFLALAAFYKKYPCLRPKDLYLTGESYAGIYVPTLARRIINSGSSHVPLPKGLAVGDACLGIDTGVCGGGPSSIYWHLLFFAGHGQIPWTTYRKVLQACHSSETVKVLVGDSDCDAALAEAYRQAGGFYTYNLYDECTYRHDLSLPRARGSANDYPCGGDLVMKQYLALPEVQKALHVEGAQFFSVDNAEGDFDYTPTEKDMTSFYMELQRRSDLKVLVHNGDTDPAITSFEAQNWTSSLNFSVVEKWRPWTTDGCRNMGGYVVKYSGDFDFLTIRGAGHMVPTYKPQASYTFLKSWLTGGEYPEYRPDCSTPQES